MINLDAHFDLRPYDQTGPNSGTGFRQMADHEKTKVRTSYLILGIQEHNNNLFLFNYVAKTQALIFNWARSLPDGHQAILDRIDQF